MSSANACAGFTLHHYAHKPVQIATAALGLEGTLVLHVGGIPVHHRAVVPAHQAHQIAFGAAAC
ncbi:MAG TPA: hypothetical protein VHZ03_13200 [Trebonia sp.]|nr:hypothetical protein [Trebonia sp.]